MQHLLSAASANPENCSVLLVGAAATCRAVEFAPYVDQTREGVRAVAIVVAKKMMQHFFLTRRTDREYGSVIRYAARILGRPVQNALCRR